MNDIEEKLRHLHRDIDSALEQLKYEDLAREVKKLEKITTKNDFWQDKDQAQGTFKKLAGLKKQVEPWQKLVQGCEEALELALLNDDDLRQDLDKQFTNLSQAYEQLKKDLLYSGKYDNYDVIMRIYAGAGGTDAQDWADILMRMYLRWVQSHPNITAKIIEQSSGEEAGIKGATIKIDGPLAYGKLQGENGVHRLVRLSPFNADNLRHTSFAKVEVMPKIDQPDDIKVNDKDLKIDVFRASGHGGQSVNTTDSAVRVTHLPTGITVAIQNERSQLQNKETALTILRSRLLQMKIEQHKEKIDDLKGPNEQAAWGNQIRSYVLQPYTMAKDLRTQFETQDVQAVLNGAIDNFIRTYLEWHQKQPDKQ